LTKENLTDFANWVRWTKDHTPFNKKWNQLTGLSEDDFYITLSVFMQAELVYPKAKLFPTYFNPPSMLPLMTNGYKRKAAEEKFIYTLQLGNDEMTFSMNLTCVQINSCKHLFTNDCHLVVTINDGLIIQLYFNPTSLCLISDNDIILTTMQYNCIIIAALKCPSSNMKYNVNALNNFVKRKK